MCNMSSLLVKKQDKCMLYTIDSHYATKYHLIRNYVICDNY